jgi:TPP-dependent pyruvate/acetoin dehydrogenase alpha subunit
MDAQLRRELFFQMLRIRMVEESIADRYAEQEMRCPVHLSIGQEAVAVGVRSALCSADGCACRQLGVRIEAPQDVPDKAFTGPL